MKQYRMLNEPFSEATSAVYMIGKHTNQAEQRDEPRLAGLRNSMSKHERLTADTLSGLIGTILYYIGGLVLHDVPDGCEERVREDYYLVTEQ